MGKTRHIPFITTMSRSLRPLLMALFLAGMAGCTQVDDIEYIFTGKEWHLAGFYQTTDWDNPNKGSVLNGYNSHSDLAAYNLLLLTDGTAIITLPQGCQLSAEWEADGNEKKRTFTFSEWKVLSGNPEALTGYGRQMYDQLQKVSFYQGDSNYIRLFNETKRYFMQFGDRNKFNP